MAARVDRLVPTATDLVGVGLVLYRQLPRVKRYLAYLPEGPVIDWAADDLRRLAGRRWSRHLQKAGAFGVRMGPPVVVRRWDAAAVKAGVADDAVRRLGDVPPTERSAEGARVVSQLQELGWRPQAVEGGFAAGQPQLQLPDPAAQPRRRAAHRGRRARRDEPAVAPQHQEGRQGRGRGHPRRPVAGGRGPRGLPRALRPHRRARPLHPPAAGLLRDDVPRARRRGARPDPALPRPPRGRPGRGHRVGPGRRPHLVLLRRVLHREARRARVQRRAVGDDPRRARGRRRRSTTCAASPTPSTPTTRTSG